MRTPINLGPILTLIIAIVIAGSVIALLPRDPLVSVAFDGKSGYRIKDVYTHTQNEFRAMLEDGKKHGLRVEILKDVSHQQADRTRDIMATQLATLYENARSPYPGELSQEIACPPEFRPVQRTYTNRGIRIDTYTAFMTDRFTLGACTESQATHRVFAAVYYCPVPKTFVSLEFIDRKDATDTERMNRLAGSIGCR